jgi:hypothetical protein
MNAGQGGVLGRHVIRPWYVGLIAGGSFASM